MSGRFDGLGVEEQAPAGQVPPQTKLGEAKVSGVEPGEEAVFVGSVSEVDAGRIDRFVADLAQLMDQVDLA